MLDTKIKSCPRYQSKQKLTTEISKLGSLDCDQIVPLKGTVLTGIEELS